MQKDLKENKIVKFAIELWNSGLIFKLVILTVLIFSLTQALLIRPDNFPIVIGLNPHYQDIMRCAQSQKTGYLLQYGQNESSLYPRINISNST